MGYAFDNASVHSREQHRCLSEMLDPLTTTRLAQTGVSDGWNCLEVGAGGGSVAVWLAKRVAPSGHVLATDINPVHIPGAPCLDVARHDVVRDPLPGPAFDLIYARLVLQHLPERSEVLGRLVDALRPNGWLQIDEFDISYGPALLMPDAEARELYERFLAAKASVFEAAGGDGTWGARVAQAMHEAGLVDIDPEVRVQVWHSRSPGTRLQIHHTFHLRDRFIQAGMTDDQLESVRRIMAAPTFRAASCAIYSVQGRRPKPTSRS